MPPRSSLIAVCACGGVELEALGASIARVVCYCDHCQAAGRRIEALPGAAPVLDPDGGSDFLVFRQDRVRCVRGEDLLAPMKLSQGSPTSRHVATCCNSAMHLGFDDAKHWVDVYRKRVRGEAPPVQARICTRFRPSDAGDLPGDAPAYRAYSFGLVAKILAARIAMLFGP